MRYCNLYFRMDPASLSSTLIRTSNAVMAYPFCDGHFLKKKPVQLHVFEKRKLVLFHFSMLMLSLV